MTNEGELKAKLIGIEVRSRLPIATRAFVQRAFADGRVIPVIDRKVTEKANRFPNSEEGQEKKKKVIYTWERQKWLLVRNIVEDGLTLEELKKYAGVSTRERARQLYKNALITIWNASPGEIKQDFSMSGVIVGKDHRPYKLSTEAREKISRKLKGRKLPEMAAAKIATANKGKKRSPEVREKMRTAQQERHRRKREQKQQLLFSTTEPQN